MKKILLASAFALAFNAQADTVTLKYASFLPATTSNNSVTLPKVKEKLEAESGGTLSMEFFPGGTLGAGAKTQMRLVMNGGADAAKIPVPYNPGRIGGIDVFELPGLAKDNSDASLITMKLIESGEISGLARSRRFSLLCIAARRNRPRSSRRTGHPKRRGSAESANANTGVRRIRHPRRTDCARHDPLCRRRGDRERAGANPA